MNIVFLLRPWPVYGGGETVTIALANEFVKREHKVHILYTHYVTNKEKPFIDERIIECQVPNISADEYHDFTKQDIHNANLFLKQYIIDHRIDIIIDQWWPALTLTGIKDMCGVIKCLHTSLFMPCGYENIHWKGKGILYKIMGKYIYDKGKKIKACQKVEDFFPYVHKYIFLSKLFLNEYSNFRNYKNIANKLDYCNNPLPFKTNISAEDIKQKDNIVLFVGRMHENSKKVTKILSIWKHIEGLKKFSDWKLILVGDGPDKKYYEDFAKRLNLKQYEFVGHQHPEQYYRKAKILLMTSTHEGWGMTLIESQQFGVVPIVRDTFSSVHDIILDGENGRIIGAYDSKGFVDALAELMNNDNLRERMATTCLETCRRFYVENIVDRWEIIFSQIINYNK